MQRNGAPGAEWCTKELPHLRQRKFPALRLMKLKVMLFGSKHNSAVPAVASIQLERFEVGPRDSHVFAHYALRNLVVIFDDAGLVYFLLLISSASGYGAPVSFDMRFELALVLTPVANVDAQAVVNAWRNMGAAVNSELFQTNDGSCGSVAVIRSHIEPCGGLIFRWGDRPSLSVLAAGCRPRKSEPDSV